jgi:hypothetical protein
MMACRVMTCWARVTRFARPQQLEITPDNGSQVIAYLATTRRWRTAGVLVALVGYAWLTLVPPERAELTVGVLQVLSGWFVGAVVAEARLVRRPAGERRSASLQPRDPAHYLSRPARLALPAALAVSLLVGLVSLAEAVSGPGVDGRAALLAQVAAVAVAAVVWAVRRQVLLRPQPADLPPDRQSADDAIRSRSCTCWRAPARRWCSTRRSTSSARCGSSLHRSEPGCSCWHWAQPVLGWLVATAHWPVRRPAPVPA